MSGATVHRPPADCPVEVRPPVRELPGNRCRHAKGDRRANQRASEIRQLEQPNFSAIEQSGPGWTAGRKSGLSRKSYDDVGADRIITDTQRAVNGIDRYDNFVAKAHDLANEFAAQEQLRVTLIKLKLVSDKKTKVADRPAWTEKLQYGAGGEDLRRFVSLDGYMAALQAQSPTKDQVQELGEAFVFYFCHIIHSNAQFAIDVHLNRVSRWRNRKRGGYKMALQLGFAPHLFLGEAHRLSLCAQRARTDYKVKLPTLTALRQYLADHLITPRESYFKPVRGEPHIVLLTATGLIQTPREVLVDAFDALRQTVEDKGADTVERKLKKAAPQGFDAADDLFQFLKDLDWKWV